MRQSKAAMSPRTNPNIYSVSTKARPLLSTPAAMSFGTGIDVRSERRIRDAASTTKRGLSHGRPSASGRSALDRSPAAS